MANIPHASGKDATLNLFVNGSPIANLDLKSWSIKRNVTSVNDGVCGEDRDRLDDITNYYEFDCDGFNQKMDKIDALLKDQANDDAQVQPTDKQVSLQIKTRDGAKTAYILSECSIGAWELNGGGRTDRIMQKIPLRARYCDKAS